MWRIWLRLSITDFLVIMAIMMILSAMIVPHLLSPQTHGDVGRPGAVAGGHPPKR